MVQAEVYSFKLQYPDGWTEWWSPRRGATRESLITAGLAMLEEAGVDVRIMVDLGEETDLHQLGDELTNHVSAEDLDQGEGETSTGQQETSTFATSHEEEKQEPEPQEGDDETDQAP